VLDLTETARNGAGLGLGLPCEFQTLLAGNAGANTAPRPLAPSDINSSSLYSDSIPSQDVSRGEGVKTSSARTMLMPHHRQIVQLMLLSFVGSLAAHLARGKSDFHLPQFHNGFWWILLVISSASVLLPEGTIARQASSM